MINHSADSGIPLLTEIITGPSHRMQSDGPATLDDEDIPELVEVVTPAAPPPAPPVPKKPLVPAVPALSTQDWERMEADISDRIARQVLQRIDLVLEQRVRDSLADVLQVAVAGLAQDIQQGLQQTLEEVIAHAVSQEISRLQIAKN